MLISGGGQDPLRDAPPAGMLNHQRVHRASTLPGAPEGREHSLQCRGMRLDPNRRLVSAMAERAHSLVPPVRTDQAGVDGQPPAMIDPGCACC